MPWACEAAITLETGIPSRPIYRPIVGYALRQVVTARVHVWQGRDITTIVATNPARPALVAVTSLVLASDSFDGFCLIDQLSDANAWVARVLGAEILPLPVWGWVCFGLISLWIGYKTHPRQPLWPRDFWFAGRLRRLCRFGIFFLAALACLAGHVALQRWAIH